MKLTSLHQARYGAWAGVPNGYAADPDRCAEEVPDGGRSVLSHQCNRKRGHGPEGAFCKQHDPEAKRKRDEAGQARFRKQRRREAMSYARGLHKALRTIAEGHNDPRAVAAEALAAFDSTWPPEAAQ